MVAVNHGSVSAIDAPFGGIKDSGHGLEDGAEGLKAFMVSKTVHQSVIYFVIASGAAARQSIARPRDPASLRSQ